MLGDDAGGKLEVKESSDKACSRVELDRSRALCRSGSVIVLAASIAKLIVGRVQLSEGGALDLNPRCNSTSANRSERAGGRGYFRAKSEFIPIL